MGNWFDSKNRGWIFGTWTCHQYIGNIAAAVCASIILHTATVDWKWALVIPGLANLIWGLVCLHYLPERPEHVGIETEESAAKANSTTSSTTDSVSNFILSIFLYLYLFLFTLFFYNQIFSSYF